MILTEDSALTVQGVFSQLTSLVILSQPFQDIGKYESRVQGVVMILTEDSALTVQGVFSELTSWLVLPQSLQNESDA